jgi:hypothetical protein
LQAVFLTPLQNAERMASEFATAIVSRMPPQSQSNDPEKIPAIFLALYPSAKRPNDPASPPQIQIQNQRGDNSSTPSCWNNGGQSNGQSNNNGYGGGNGNDNGGG